MDEMEIFINANIELINTSISSFRDTHGGTRPSDIQIKDFLKGKFQRELPDMKETLLNEIRDNNYVKARIIDIANRNIFYIKDLQDFYYSVLYHELMQDVNTANFVRKISDLVKEEINNDNAFRFIKSDLEKIAEKLSYLLKIKGFTANLLGINSGVMVANSGDSAQFLFLSRAILAGFNCSNVDVRSSRYDAIIDYHGKLLRVQIKGLSSNQISFKDRDRGGQGIDYTHERNRGRIISSEDCDIYVAVDKQCGICYIIPMEDYVDQLPDEEKERSINVNRVEQFRENWEIIKNVADRT